MENYATKDARTGLERLQTKAHVNKKADSLFKKTSRETVYCEAQILGCHVLAGYRESNKDIEEDDEASRLSPRAVTDCSKKISSLLAVTNCCCPLCCHFITAVAEDTG